MKTYEKYMRMAIGLAKRALGQTSPNPVVGAVIVKNGRIVGKGYHGKAGLPHAEIEALKAAGPMARGAVMFVTMEPCNHLGRTPPCTDAIIRSGVKKVVVAMKDPNPLNNGKGMRKLERSGIKTVLGILQEEARAMNRPFIKMVTKKLPYVTVKLAETLDGKIATRTGDSRWISSAESRRRVHELRGVSDAVMVGANTALKDDPMLLSMRSGRWQPVRVVVDSALRTPIRSRLFATIDRSAVIMAVTSRASAKRVKAARDRGAEVIIIRSKKRMVDLRMLLGKLAARGIASILVEGGAELAASLAEDWLVDRFLFFIAPKIIGGRGAISSIGGRGIGKVSGAFTFSDIRVEKSGPDIMIEASV